MPQSAPASQQTFLGIRIPIEAILLLIAGVGTSRLIWKGYLYPIIQGNGHLLIIDVVYFISFLAIVLIAQHGRGHAKARFWISTLAGSFVILYVLGMQLSIRPAHPTPPPIQDGAVQTEEAAKFILQGVNPYAADYTDTRFGIFPSPYGPSKPNVAWTHYVYPPLNAILAIPIVWLQRAGWAVDVSVEYTLAFIATALLVAFIQTTWSRRALIATLFLANPFLWFLPITGLNDALMLLCLVLSAVLLSRRRWVWAGVVFGLALAAKQYAWVTAPLWAWWAIVEYRRGKLKPTDLHRLILGAVISTAVIYGPFLISNAGAVYDDLVRFLSGSIPFSYPITGSTLVQYLFVFGVISSPWAPVPTSVFELLVALPLMWWAGRTILRWPSPGAILITGSVVTMGILLVSRFFLINYGMTLAGLALAGYALETARGNQVILG